MSVAGELGYRPGSRATSLAVPDSPGVCPSTFVWRDPRGLLRQPDEPGFQMVELLASEQARFEHGCQPRELVGDGIGDGGLSVIRARRSSCVFDGFERGRDPAG